MMCEKFFKDINSALECLQSLVERDYLVMIDKRLIKQELWYVLTYQVI